MEKASLGERLKQKRQARKLRAAERARHRQEHKVESNAQRAAAASDKEKARAEADTSVSGASRGSAATLWRGRRRCAGAASEASSDHQPECRNEA